MVEGREQLERGVVVFLEDSPSLARDLPTRRKFSLERSEPSLDHRIRILSDGLHPDGSQNVDSLVDRD